MRAVYVGWWLVMLSLGPGLARAQSTTVQLPTYRTFATRTTVTVPDQGAAYLGGIAGSRSAASQFGAPLVPLGHRSLGCQRSAACARVSVFVHDFEAMEEQILGCPPSALVQQREGDPSARSRLKGARKPVEVLGQPWVRAPAVDPVVPSVKAIRAQRAEEGANRQAEAEDWFRRGQLAEEAGKTHVARMFYQLAARRAAGDLKEQVQVRLHALLADEPARLAQPRAAR